MRTCDRGLAAERQSSSGVSAPSGGVVAAEEGGPSKAVKELQQLAGREMGFVLCLWRCFLFSTQQYRWTCIIPGIISTILEWHSLMMIALSLFVVWDIERESSLVTVRMKTKQKCWRRFRCSSRFEAFVQYQVSVENTGMQGMEGKTRPDISKVRYLDTVYQKFGTSTYRNFRFDIQNYLQTYLHELGDGYTAAIGGGVIAVGELYQVHPVVGNRFKHPLYEAPDVEKRKPAGR